MCPSMSITKSLERSKDTLPLDIFPEEASWSKAYSQSANPRNTLPCHRDPLRNSAESVSPRLDHNFGGVSVNGIACGQLRCRLTCRGG
jgi:hypothetical protein